MTDLDKFRQKLAERRAAEEAQKKRAAEARAALGETHDDDLIPDEPYERSDEDREMDRIIENIDIIEAYNRWCGKMTPLVKHGQREGVKISCPVPTHADKNPSAWINLDKQTWFCGGCQVGGDAHDIAAYHFNYPVPGYKDGAQFHELRRDMAKDFGFTFTTMPGGTTVITPPEPEEMPEGKVVEPEPTTEPEPKEADVIDLYDADEFENLIFPPIDWKDMLPVDTYLRTYMEAACVDDVAEEYHFWNAMIGLGFALGREVRLMDFHPVYGNLFVCTLGRSGSGKSKARSYLTKVLTDALPHDWSDPNSKGVRRIQAPGSAEVLIQNFQKPVTDPTDPKKVLYHAPVRGMIDFNELSSLVSRTNRQGNALIPTLMQFYDMDDVVATSSVTHGVKEAPKPFASALTTTQPKSLKGLISKQDDASGFLNRWVFAPGRDKQRFAIGGIQVDMSPVTPKLQNIVGWAASFGPDEMMQWSPEAAKRFTEFFHNRIELDRKRGDSELLIRLDLLMKKLILLFTANRTMRVVPLASVEDAISCYEYLLAAYAIPASEIGNTLGHEMNEAIMAQARKQWNIDKKGVTLNQVAKALKHKKYPMDLLVKAVETLVKLGYLEPQASKPGAVGRPTVRYKYVV